MLKPVETTVADIEASVLGTLMASPAAGAHIGRLEPDYFSDPLSQALFPAIREAFERHGRADGPVVMGLLNPKEDAAPEMRRIIGELVAHRSLGPASMPGIVAALVTNWQRRAMHEVLERAKGEITAGYDAGQIGHDLVSDMDLILAASRKKHEKSVLAYEAASKMIASLENPEAKDPPISTGLVSLDRVIGGYRRGSLVMLAGRPGMGKSTFAPSSLLRVAAAGHGVGFFSLEMTLEQISARCLTDLAYSSTNTINYEDILNQSDLNEMQRRMLSRARDRMRSMPLMLDPQPGLGVSEIAARARGLHSAFERQGVRLGVICIDHLGKIRVPNDRRRDGRHLELGEMTAALADLSKELDCCVLLLCQLNRGLESRDNKRPQLSDLRESGRIEEDADCVIGLYREAYYLNQRTEDDGEKELIRRARFDKCEHDLEAIVLKNRHGAQGTVNLFAHMPTSSIRCLARDH